MIDLHFHLLPGMDDGPADLDAAMGLARAAVAAGVDTIVATPHVSWDWYNSADEIASAVASLQSRLDDCAVPLRVLAGAEVALTRAIGISDDELRRLSLGGGSWLLLELPQTSEVVGLESQLMHLQRRGHRIVIAHAERCPTFVADLSVLERLVQSGMAASVTAGALVGRFGKTPQRFAERLVDARLVHNIASDAHNRDRRPPGLAEELAAAGLTAQTKWLTQDVPTALIAGSDIPQPPAWPLPRRSRLHARPRR